MSLVIPKGVAYFDELDANGNPTGEYDLGFVSSSAVSTTSNSLPYINPRTGLSEKVADVVTEVIRTAKATVNSITKETLALFYAGDFSTINQVATPVVDNPRTVKKDRSYQLGTGAGSESGVKGVTGFVLTDDLGTTTYVDTVDYTVDLALARYYIIPGGSIPDDQAVLEDYTPDANTRERIASSSLGSKDGTYRVISDNPEGPDRDTFCPKVTLKPSGDAVLISQDPVYYALNFDIEILKRDNTTESIYTDGRPA